MQLCFGLKGVVEGNEEGRVPDGLEDLALGLGVLRSLRLLHDARLLEHLHGVQVAAVGARHLANEEYLPVRWQSPKNQSRELRSVHSFNRSDTH